VAGFPDNDLDLALEAAFGADLTAAPSSWAFTDLSARIIDNPITINHGVVVGNGTTRTAAATGLTLLNDDGALTPLLPTSPYWPYVDVGTPIRVRLRDTLALDTFTRTLATGWGRADRGNAWTTASGQSTNGTSGLLSHTTVNSIRLARINLGTYQNLDAQADFTVPTTVTGTGPVNAGILLRSNTTNSDNLWITAKFNADNTVIIEGWKTTSGSLTLTIGVNTGLTYTAGTPVTLRVVVSGTRIQARLWTTGGTEPSTWPYDQTAPTVAGPALYAGIQTWLQSGNTNTLPYAITVDNVRMSRPLSSRIEGYISDVRPSFQPTSDGVIHSVVQIDIGGVGTRLERRQAPELGPLRRSLQQSTATPLAYWPCEDKSGSLTAASAFPGQAPMTVVGPAVFDFDTGLPDDDLLAKYGSTAMCSVAAGAKLSAIVPPPSSTTAWTVSVSAYQYTPTIGGGVTEVRVAEWNTPSSLYSRWALVATITGYLVRAYNDTAGTSTDVAVYTGGAFSQQIGYDITATQVGGNITVNLYVVTNLVATGTVAATMGAVTAVSGNPDRVNTTASVSPSGIRFLLGHFMVHDSAVVAAVPYYVDGSKLVRADRAWTREAAHRRLLRLCTEEAIPCTVVGDPYTSGITVLGPQQPGAFTDLATSAIEAESGGLLIEGGFGYVHIPRTYRYNRTADLVVDMSTYRRSADTAGTDVLVPKLDARGPNYWTVQRTAGSSSTAAASAAYRDRRGTISQQVTLDVLTDADTAQHANWRVHQSVDGNQANYPNFVLDFAANPGLLEAWWQCDIGSRVQRTNQPTIAGYGTIDQVIDGISETFVTKTGGGTQYRATLNLSPAAVWDVGVYGTSVYGSSTTTLGVAVTTTTATSFLIRTARFEHRWSTTGVPYNWNVGGEDVTVTAITGYVFAGGTYNQTATVTRGVGGFAKTHAVGEQVVLSQRARYGLSGGPSQ
jgi:hypothetical protein